MNTTDTTKVEMKEELELVIACVRAGVYLNTDVYSTADLDANILTAVETVVDASLIKSLESQVVDIAARLRKNFKMDRTIAVSLVVNQLAFLTAINKLKTQQFLKLLMVKLGQEDVLENTEKGKHLIHLITINSEALKA